MGWRAFAQTDIDVANSRWRFKGQEHVNGRGKGFSFSKWVALELY